MSDFYELAMRLFGFDPEDDKDFEDFEEKAENLIYEKYEIEVDNFEKLLKDLVKFTPIIKTAVTETPVQGFVDVKKQMFLYKEEVKTENKKGKIK